MQRAYDYPSADSDVPQRLHHSHRPITIQPCSWLVAEENARFSKQLERFSTLCVSHMKEITGQNK